MRIVLFVCIALLGCISVFAQAKEEKKQSADTAKKETVTRTIEVKSVEDLQKLMQIFTNGGGEVTAKDSAKSAVEARNVVTDNGGMPRREWWAKSIRNQKAPELKAIKWINDRVPVTKGKFVLYHLWSTTCKPCLKSIPKLNELSKLFKDEMVVIGVSTDDSVERMQGKPVIEYYRARDNREIMNAIDAHVLSYVLLVDPEGIVRLEGVSHDLTPELVRTVIDKYKKK